MMTVCRRAAGGLGIAAIALVVMPGVAFGHTAGAGATTEHVLIEMAEWGLAVAAALGIVIVILWLRARQHRE